MMSRASARAIKSIHDHAHAAGWPHDTQTTEHESETLVQRPNTGRTSQLGRKVEKPAEPKPGGPSGQHDRVKHDKRHANE